MVKILEATEQEMLKNLILDINNVCRTSITSTDKVKEILHLCDIYEDKLRK